MRKLVLTIILFQTIGCVSNSAERKKVKEISTKGKSYSVISEDSDIAIGKTNIKIRLQGPINKNELKSLAININKERPDYRLLWIFYYLPGQDTKNGAWAISHFKPELDLKILGASKEGYRKMRDEKVSGEIIGTWYDNDAILPNKKFLVKEEGKLYMKSVYADNGLIGTGGKLTEQVFKLKEKNLVRYNYENIHGEYYLIEENGNLSLYDDSGKFKEMRMLNLSEIK